MQAIVIALLLALSTLAKADTGASANSHILHVEADPLPFALGGHGIQVGYRPASLSRLRIALANFSLEVPDRLAQFDSANSEFHLKVLPTPALFVHYHLSHRRSGFLVGGSLRYLRVQYRRDGFPNTTTRASEINLEAIVGYRWFPTIQQFYLHPFLGFSRALHTRGTLRIGDKSYKQAPLQPFFTVNLGWQFTL